MGIIIIIVLDYIKNTDFFFSAGLVGFLQFLSVLYHLNLID